jgi:hypothetical protein
MGVRPLTRQPLPHEAAMPFDYARPTQDEMSAAIGSTNWCLARRGKQIIERYGPDVVCLSQVKYAAAEAKAIELRGWARPCELVIVDMLGLLKIGSLGGPAVDDVIREAEALLIEAKKPR